MKSYKEQLETVQKAIEIIELHGQSHSIDGDGERITLTRANLSVLHSREKRLMGLVHREEHGSISYGI